MLHLLLQRKLVSLHLPAYTPPFPGCPGWHPGQQTCRKGKL
jgi:hypothetical protein